MRTNLSRKQELPVGSEIVVLNGQPTAEYIRQHVAPYISSSTAHVLEDWSASWLLQGLAGDRSQLRGSGSGSSLLS